RLPRRKVAPKPEAGRRPMPVASVAVSDEAHSDGDEEQALKNKVISEFEAALRDQPGMDEEGLEVVMDYLLKAVEETPLDAALAPPRPEDWAKTLDLMVQGGSLKEEDRNHIARQFEEACESLQDKKVKIAIEF